jgi:hypothetical protein
MTADGYLLAQQESLERDPQHWALLTRAAYLDPGPPDTHGGRMAAALRTAAGDAARLAGDDHHAPELLREAAAAAESGDWARAHGTVLLLIKAWRGGQPAGQPADSRGWLALRSRIGRMATILRRIPRVEAARAAEWHAQADEWAARADAEEWDDADDLDDADDWDATRADPDVWDDPEAAAVTARLEAEHTRRVTGPGRPYAEITRTSPPLSVPHHDVPLLPVDGGY